LIYKRDKCGLVCEILIPIILVIIGLGLLQVGWLKDSPAFFLDTSAYPGPQRVLFNSENVVASTNQFTPQELAQSLPDYDSYWNVSYNDTQDLTWKDYYNAIAE